MGNKVSAGQSQDTAAVAVRLQVAMTRLRSRLREESGMTSSGLTLSQLALLHRIVDSGPTTAAQLATAEHVSQQAIAQSVAALKETALVDGERDAQDGRKVLINVTDAGHTLYESMLASPKTWLARAIDASIDPADRRGLDAAIDMLERLAAADLDQGSR
jgi:DNA-binding MarR family transcriptional regulator